MKLRQTLQFLLYQWLDTETLCQRPRFSDPSRETFDAVLDTCERIAREKYAPFNREVDTQEPYVKGDKVVLPQATHGGASALHGDALVGTMAATRYFYHYELGKIDAWLAPVERCDMTCAEMPEEAF